MTLREAPVEHHHLTEIPNDHILSLEVTVDDAARMGVGDVLQTVTNAFSRVKKSSGSASFFARFSWIGLGRLCQGAPLMKRMV